MIYFILFHQLWETHFSSSAYFTWIYTNMFNVLLTSTHVHILKIYLGNYLKVCLNLFPLQYLRLLKINRDQALISDFYGHIWMCKTLIWGLQFLKFLPKPLLTKLFSDQGMKCLIFHKRALKNHFHTTKAQLCFSNNFVKFLH